MDEIRLLVDFGSTYTKIVAVDLYQKEIIAQAYVPSTIETDITIGLKDAMEIIKQRAKIKNLDKIKSYACSSAAGGLRMVCIGFVPAYTSKAANYAALGAGAKIVDCFSYKLNISEINRIESLAPDIILLCGGTDGGDYKVLLHNAKELARTSNNIKHIIVAGNKTTHVEIKNIFKDSEKHLYFTENVMPELKQLNLEPCKKIIRELFINNIIEAKGIAKAKEIIQEVIMPTPAAVLEATQLISTGYKDSAGFGELVLIDIGGATTDVYSIGKGLPSHDSIIMEGLPEPFQKRTVEGDLGLRHNLDTLAGLTNYEKAGTDFKKEVRFFQEGSLPKTKNQWEYYTTLTKTAVEIAVNRHVGRLDVRYGPEGKYYVQQGKDLTAIDCIIGTGGPLIFHSNPRQIMEGAAFKPETPNILKPKKPRIFLDRFYILFAVGLLSKSCPTEALSIAKKYVFPLS